MSKEVREGFQSARERLRQMTTVGEILETAMAFEKAAQTFYAALAKRVSKPMRQLVEELALEETRHYRLFEELKTRPDAHSHITDRIATPAANHKFSDYIHLPELGENPDDQSILQYAMGRESVAAEEYAELATTAPEGPIRDLFRFLANEELEHKAELEKLYYQVVHSGGV
jgi:rubrerythrin